MEEARTRIVCTVGPASSSVAVLRRMMQSGMDVARLNFSHGSHAEHSQLLKAVRSAAKKSGKTIAVLQDLQGPKIRVGDLPKEGIALHEGSTVILNPLVKVYDKLGSIPVSYGRLHHDVAPGQRIFLDDGYLELEVLRVRGRNVHCYVKTGGLLTSHKGINLPDSTVSVSSFTNKDHQDLLFGLAQGVDWICLSFVTSPEVLHKVKDIIRKEARRLGVRPPLIMAKIERQAALSRIDEIIEAAQGIMIGRGDLGVEIPFEDVPIIQKDIIERCRLASKPVVVATQMLESMRTNPRATRAEVSDVANAVFDHADAVMLSAESATGKYPATTVQAMASVIREAESSRFDHTSEDTGPINCVASSLAHTLSVMANRGLIQAVGTSSSLGSNLGFLNMFRLRIPIFLAVPDASAARQAVLNAGFTPVIIDDHAATFELRFRTILKKHLRLKHGQRIALVLPGLRGAVSLSVVMV